MIEFTSNKKILEHVRVNTMVKNEGQDCRQPSLWWGFLVCWQLINFSLPFVTWCVCVAHKLANTYHLAGALRAHLWWLLPVSFYLHLSNKTINNKKVFNLTRNDLVTGYTSGNTLMSIISVHYKLHLPVAACGSLYLGISWT